MEQTQKEAKYILFIDFGAVNTRICLFEKEENEYAFSGAAVSRTIYDDTGSISWQGVVEAAEKLEKSTGHVFLDANNNIILPGKPDHSGIDQVVSSFSCNSQPRIVLMGLTKSGSIRNLETLLGKTGMTATTKICGMEDYCLTGNLDAILNGDPHIVVIAGGTEKGAEKAVYRLGEVLLLVCKSLPKEQRPYILYLGNSSAKPQFEKVFSKISDITFGPNALDSKNFGSKTSLGAFISVIQKKTLRDVPAIRTLKERTGARSIPAAFAFGRCIRLMSRIGGKNKSALGIDIGASHSIIACASNMNLEMANLPLGVGRKITDIQIHYGLHEIQQWIPFQIRESEIRDYLWNKSVYPDLIPANKYSAQIEQAVARLIIKTCAKEHNIRQAINNGYLGMVLLSGAVIRNVEDPGDALMIAMDGLHPAGMTDYYLDMNGLAFALGTFISENQELAAQLTKPSSFLNLGRVFTPLTNAKEGKKLFGVSIRDSAGNVKKYNIVKGGVQRIHLAYGQYYELDWFDMAQGVVIPGIRTWTPVGFRSGSFGIIFDTRGELSDFPSTHEQRIADLDRWRHELGPWVPKS